MEPQTPTEEHTTVTAVPQTTTPETSAPRSYTRHIVIGFVVLLILFLAAYAVYLKKSVDIAAVVNGTKITQEEVNENIEMMQRSAEAQGVDVADPTVMAEIETQALENLISNELLLSAAKKSGVSANEAAIQSAYESLVTEVGGEEELKSRMETVGLSSDSLMGNISDRLVVDQYIESVTDIESLTVSEEELATYIESMQAQGVTLPDIEEIKPQLESSILAQKQQTIVDDLIAKLRSEATIEIQ